MRRSTALAFAGLYRSRDGGASWEKANASQLLLYPKDFSVHPRDSRRILIGACDAGRGDASGGLYATEDGGATWRRLGRRGPQAFGGYFHPDREGWIYMTLTGGGSGGRPVAEPRRRAIAAGEPLDPPPRHIVIPHERVVPLLPFLLEVPGSHGT